MSEGRQCSGCGARVTQSEGRFCQYCGAELPALPREEPPPSESSPDPFAALSRDPALEQILALRPSTAAPMMGYGCGIVAGFFFIAVSLFVFTGFQMVGGFPFSLFPLLFVGIGVTIVVVSIRKAMKYGGAPLESRPALVSGERTMVTGGGRDSSASTSYFVTLEFEDGRREEYRTTGKVTGEVREGDLGVAFVKGGYLLDFRRL
jgi:hypothetical protein